MSQVRITAIDPARADVRSARLPALHHPHLHRRVWVRNHSVCVHIKGVVHRPRRMMLGNIERAELW